MTRFGEKEWVALWRVIGPLDCLEAKALGESIAGAVNMEIVSSTLDTFPHPTNGKGGVGIQIYWAWTESFLVISTWPELNMYRVYLASCKQFDVKDVIKEISKHGIPTAFELMEI